MLNPFDFYWISDASIILHAHTGSASNNKTRVYDFMEQTNKNYTIFGAQIVNSMNEFFGDWWIRKTKINCFAPNRTPRKTKRKEQKLSVGFYFHCMQEKECEIEEWEAPEFNECPSQITTICPAKWFNQLIKLIGNQNICYRITKAMQSYRDVTCTLAKLTVLFTLSALDTWHMFAWTHT